MTKPIGPDLIFHLTAVADPSLSPDGSTLLFTKAKTDPDSMEGESQIMKMDLGSKSTQRFTQGPKDGMAKFSPHGAHVAFLRTDDNGKRQLWMMQSCGGEAEPMTEIPGGISNFVWSPDSKKICFVADVDPDYTEEDPEKPKIPEPKVVTRMRYRFDTLGWIGNKHRHLFVIDINERVMKQITDGDWDDSAPDWSPDSKEIAFVSSRTDRRELEFCTEAYVVSASGGEPELRSNGLHNVGAVKWSPDGMKILAIASEDPELGALWQGFFYILERGKPAHAISDDKMKLASGFGPIIPAPEIRWTSDRKIHFLAEIKGESFYCSMPDNGGAVEKITKGGALIGQISTSENLSKAVFVESSPQSIADLYYLNPITGEKEQLTAFNTEFYQEHPPARTEKFTLERAGMQIESRVYFPPDFDEAKQYPLILDVHGGPHGVYYDAFVLWQQVLATNGYIVLAVNPRGSSTYGAEFLKAVIEDWGGEDYLDLMQAVDELCSRPYVDEARLGIHGYSYGGFMSSWVVGQTTRFGAACIGAPVVDLPSFWGTSDIGVPFGEIQWGGTRFEAYDKYLKHSPLTYVENVQTPVLLLHGEDDYRCPIEQSEQFFMALKRLNKAVEFVRFPGCSHLFLRFGHPNLRREYLAKVLGWFDKHLK